MKKFTIYKNQHSSKLFGFLPHVRFSFRNKFSYKIKFDKNCLYNLEGVDKWDINKLCGVNTSCGHHIQSARFGWRCMDGKNIEILAYCYNDKKRIGGFVDYILGTVKPGEIFECSIAIEDNEFILSLKKDSEISIKKLEKSNTSWKFKYFLFPFFGGNMTAPHKMNIWIEEKK